MEYEKICKMHGQLDKENIIIEPNKSAKRGYTLRCRLCKLNKDRKWTSENRQYKTEYSIRYKKEHQDQYNQWMREDRKKNPEKYKRYEENYIKKHGSIKVRKMEVARIHGITIEQYDSMFEQQNYKCKICGLEETRKGKSGQIAPLCVDHCHKSGKIRALLCQGCNLMIGYARDNIDLLKLAMRYLEQHQHIKDDSTGVIHE